VQKLQEHRKKVRKSEPLKANQEWKEIFLHNIQIHEQFLYKKYFYYVFDYLLFVYSARAVAS
jgi:hypothetical protein